MKWLYRLGIISIIIYIAGVLFTIYFLNGWNSNLISSLGLADAKSLTQINQATNQVFFAIAIETVLGFFAILFLLLSRQAQTQVIYVDKNKTQDQQFNAQSDEKLEYSGKAYREHLETIKQFIKQIIQEQDAQLLREKLEKILWEVAKATEAVQGVIYLKKEEIDDITRQKAIPKFVMTTTYALYQAESQKVIFQLGEGLVGQVAKDKSWILFDQVPQGYLKVVSGLGTSSPNFLLLVPIIEDHERDETQGVIEIAAFSKFTQKDIAFVQEVALLLAKENMVIEPILKD